MPTLQQGAMWYLPNELIPTLTDRYYPGGRPVEGEHPVLIVRPVHPNSENAHATNGNTEAPSGKGGPVLCVDPTEVDCQGGRGLRKPTHFVLVGAGFDKGSFRDPRARYIGVLGPQALERLRNELDLWTYGS